jgi:hypothetical protein
MFSAVLVLFLAFNFRTNEGGLEAKMVSEIGEGFAKADPVLADMVSEILSDHAYVLIASTVWLWVIMVYVMALVAHLILDTYKRTIRPVFSIQEGGLPRVLPLLLAGCVVAAFAAEGQVQFAARALLLIALLPYFLFGLAQIHRLTLGWNARSFLLSIFYILMLTTLWPAVCVCVYGVVLQMKEFSGSTVSLPK